uniref:Uncharacterized protein n=1 Tax=viral metagenome TaxID=1070528 RepID=A0A6M3LUD8_9ZZZZ
MNNATWGYIPCQNSHAVKWTTADTTTSITPRGMVCECGLMVSDGRGGATLYWEWVRGREK